MVVSVDPQLALRARYPTGRKLCTSPFHQGQRWCSITNFAARGEAQNKIWVNGEDYPILLQSWCLTCYRIYGRERMRNKRGYPTRTVMALGRPMTRTERGAKWYKKIRKDRQRWQDRLEYQRIWRDAKRAESSKTTADTPPQRLNG